MKPYYDRHKRNFLWNYFGLIYLFNMCLDIIIILNICILAHISFLFILYLKKIIQRRYVMRSFMYRYNWNYMFPIVTLLKHLNSQKLIIDKYTLAKENWKKM